jgi:hypothetical protein
MSEVGDLFVRQCLLTSIKLAPRYVSSNVHEKIVQLVHEKFDGKTCAAGYVRRGSIRLDPATGISPLTVELATLRGYMLTRVEFQADVFLPSECRGPPVLCTVRDVGSLGLVLVAQLQQEYTVMEVLVPIGENYTMVRSEVDLKGLRPGMRVPVEVVRRRIEVGSDRLQAIGRVLSASSATVLMTSPTSATLASTTTSSVPVSAAAITGVVAAGAIAIASMGVDAASAEDLLEMVPDGDGGTAFLLDEDPGLSDDDTTSTIPDAPYDGIGGMGGLMDDLEDDMEMGGEVVDDGGGGDSGVEEEDGGSEDGRDD